MECKLVEQLLTDFLEGELPASTAGEVRRHVINCDSCRKELLRRQQLSSRLKLSLPVSSSADWLDRMERKLPRVGLWSEITRGLFLPWEKRIPILAALSVILLIIPLALHQIGCEQKKGDDIPAVSAPTPGEKAEPVKLRKSSHGSVLILDEGTGKGKDSAAGQDIPPAQRKLPDYRPFQDQQVKLFVPDVKSSLAQAVKVAQESGGQVITYSIKGFENMGPNEKTLVFDMRSYSPFLKKLQTLGRIEHPPIIRSDYVTVRLTLLPETGNSPK